MIERHAELTFQLVSSSVRSNGFDITALSDPTITRSSLQGYLLELSQIPGVFRVVIYDNKGQVVWSDEPSIIDSHVDDSAPLNVALDGQLAFEWGTIGTQQSHGYGTYSAELTGKDYVEIYIPLFAEGEKVPEGVVEIYRLPVRLFDTIRNGILRIWQIAFAIGALLFLVLYWMIREASTVIDTQQKALLETETAATIGKFTSLVAHSVRNPLSSIRSSAEILDDEVRSESRETLDTIITGVDRINAWVDELLTFTKSDTVDLESFPISDVMDECVQQFLHKHDDGLVGIATVTDLSDEHVRANRATLRQIVSHLLDNAADAMTDGGDIKISALLNRRRTITLRISDNGPGLPPQVMENLFKPFTTTKSHGLGLGLVLSRDLMLKMNGTLEIQNNPDYGATAVLVLPRAES